MSIAAQLRRMRKTKNVSLQIAADAVGIAKPHLWALERGRSDNPTIKTLCGLAKYYGVTVAFLIGEKA